MTLPKDAFIDERGISATPPELVATTLAVLKAGWPSQPGDLVPPTPPPGGVEPSVPRQCGSFSRKYPYNHVPVTALSSVTPTARSPMPICAKSGPGHAPVSAHPNPKINPP